MNNLSAVILTRNEEKNMADCLKTVSFADEAVVIDDFSEDLTVEIARKKGAKVWQRKLNNNFASQRNFGLKKAKKEWVLFVDADERISLPLQKEILQSIKANDFRGYFLKRDDYFFNKKLKFGETSKVRLLRLGRRGAGKWQRKVHETWVIKGKTGQLKNPLLHYPHSSITRMVKAINFYSTLHAEALLEAKKEPSFFRIIFYPLGKFVQNYLLRLGFLDKTPGLIMAMMMSFHSFLAQGKLFLLSRKQKK